VTQVRGGDDFAAVSAAFKRMKNILAQAAEKGDLPRGDEDKMGTPVEAEAALSAKATELGKQVSGLAEKRDYVLALEAMATLRPVIDTFFDKVMVMDPEREVRHRRLLMLQRILRTFSGIADFSEIVTAG
jgi:glycyl-tRNA synthetase beta chain